MKKLTYAQQQEKWAKRRQKVKALRAAGMKMPEIGKVMGISKQRVEQILRMP